MQGQHRVQRFWQVRKVFAELDVEAVLGLKGSTDIFSVQIVKKVGGSLNDSFLKNGFVLDR